MLRSWRLAILVSLALPCLMLNAATASAESSAELQQAFRDGVQQASRIVDRLHVQWQQTFTYERVRTGRRNGKSREVVLEGPVTTTSRGALHGEWILRETVPSGASAEERTLEAVNGDYAFQLFRTGESGPWTITFLERLGDDPQVDASIDDRSHRTRMAILGTWTVANHPLTELVGSPDFEIRDATVVTGEDGTQRVRIEYDHPTADPDRKLLNLTDAWLLCDPAHHWALCEHGGTTWAGERYRTVVEWGDLVDGFPLARSLRTTVTSAEKSDIEFRSRIEIEGVSGDPDPESFYLAHYGFPEPVFRSGIVGPWLGYLAVGAVLLVAAAWWRGYLRQT